MKWKRRCSRGLLWRGTTIEELEDYSVITAAFVAAA